MMDRNVLRATLPVMLIAGAGYLFLLGLGALVAIAPVISVWFWPANAWLLAWLCVLSWRQGAIALLLSIAASWLLCYLPGAMGGLLPVHGWWINALSVVLAAWLLRRTGLSVRFYHNAQLMLLTLAIGGLLPALTAAVLEHLLDHARADALLWLQANLLGSLSTLPLALWLTQSGFGGLGRRLWQWRSLGVIFLVCGLTLLSMRWFSAPFGMIAMVEMLASLALPLGGMLVLVWLENLLIVAALGLGLLGQPSTSTLLDQAISLLPLLLVHFPALILMAAGWQRTTERAAMLLAKKRLDTVFDSLREGIVIQNLAGQIIGNNQRAIDILGLGQDTLAGWNPYESGWYARHEDGSPFPVDEHPAVQVLATGEDSNNVTMGLRLPDGTVLWLEVSARQMEDPSSQERMSVCSFSDITVVRQNLQALRALEARYIGLVNSAPDAILTVDRTFTIVNVNPAAAAMFGYPLESMAGMSIHALVPASQREAHATHAMHFARGEVDGKNMAKGRKVNGIRSDGSLFPLEVTLATVALNDGVFYMAIGRDLSQRRAHENSLLELTQAIGQSPNGFVLLDKDGRIDYANQAFVDIVGSLPSPLETIKLDSLWHYSIYTQPGLRPWDILRCGQTWSGEVRQVRQDGGEYYVHYVIAPLTNAEGNINRFVAVAQDVTESKLASQELEAHRNHLESLVEERTRDLNEAKQVAETAARTKTTFLANMSHEIRTPLNAILGFAHLMRSKEPNPRLLGYLDKIDSAAQHLLGVINDVLDLSKLEAGRIEVEEAPYDLQQLMEFVRDLIQPRLLDKLVKLHLEIADNVPTVLLGDRLRLSQILTNFGGNAAKFTDSGSITLKVLRQASAGAEAQLCFEVHDTGIGISDAQKARLFQPFSQADGSITRRFGGTGLGLALSRSLAQIMGGEVGVDSEPGKGSCFWLRVPLRLPAAADLAAMPSAVVSSAVSPVEAQVSGRPGRYGGRLLVAEDNPMNQEVLQGLLEDLGVSCLMVDDGQQAVAACLQEHFDLVLMDMQMPVMDGLSATRVLRETFSAEALPIIALTANAFAEDREACLRAGMNDFLSKPLDPVLLAARLSDYLPENQGEPAPASVNPQTATAASSRPAVAEAEPEPGQLGQRLRDAGLVDFSHLWRMIGGNVATLERLLQLFLDYHTTLPPLLLSQMLAGDRAAAERTAHTLKGTGLSLGASALADAALSVEMALRNGQQMPVDCRALVSEVDKIRNCLLAQPTAAVSAPQLAAFRAMLQADDFHALQWFRDNQSGLAFMPQAEREQLGRLIEQFAFAAALQLLDSLQMST